MQFVSGWLVDRFEVNWVMAAGFLVWSLATSATGLVRGFTMLLGMRLMLGVGESVMVPACSKIFSFHLPEHSRGLANGVLQVATQTAGKQQRKKCTVSLALELFTVRGLP